MENDRLEQLKSKISVCRICVERPATTPLPHEPRPVVVPSSKAKICIAGQAPGLRVHESGIPFNDPSGDRLRNWLGVERDQFYNSDHFAIIPMGFCFPGYDAKKSDLPPRRECGEAWHDQLFDLMPQLELVLVIGQYAQKYHLGKLRKSSLTATAADWRNILQASTKPRYLPLPHPSWRNTSWLKKNPWFDAEVVPFLQSEVKRLTGK